MRDAQHTRSFAYKRRKYARLMAERQRHEVNDSDRRAALARAEQRGLVLSGEQADALGHITYGRDLGVLVGRVAGAICQHLPWRPQGVSVQSSGTMAEDEPT